MQRDKIYPIHKIRERYLPVSDIPQYYEDISEDDINSLLKSNSVGYAELKSFKDGKRVPHVDMLDVLTALGKDTTMKHLATQGDQDV